MLMIHAARMGMHVSMTALVVSSLLCRQDDNIVQPREHLYQSTGCSVSK